MQSPFVLFSDEWYILAEQSLPSLEEYGNVNLVENGVGQVQNFISRFENESKIFPKALHQEKNITIATGMLVYKIFQDKVIPILNQINNMNVIILIID